MIFTEQQGQTLVFYVLVVEGNTAETFYNLVVFVFFYYFDYLIAVVYKHVSWLDFYHIHTVLVFGYCAEFQKLAVKILLFWFENYRNCKPIIFKIKLIKRSWTNNSLLGSYNELSSIPSKNNVLFSVVFYPILTIYHHNCLSIWISVIIHEHFTFGQVMSWLFIVDDEFFLKLYFLLLP